jgi:hypothetical protein
MATGKMKSNFKMPTPTAAERMNAQHQQVRKAAGLPDPSDYLKMAAQKKKEIEDMKKDQEKENNPNQGRFSSGASKPVIGTQPLVKSEAVTVGRVGGRGNIHMYDRNPAPKDGSELENVPFHAKTEKQKKLQNALTDLGKKMKETHPKLREAKDPQEYDYEGDMAKSDLRSIMHHAKELHDMIDDNTNLAEWCQSKITLSEDYLSTVANYMRSEMSEGNNFITVFKKGTRMKQKINPNSYAAFKHHGFRKEETEELDEISASTKASYTSKAKDQIKQSMPYTKKGEEYRDIAKNFIAKRQKGIAKANEAVEQMDELDKSTIKSYVSKKMKDSTVSNSYLNKSYKKDKENLGRAHDRLYGKKANEEVELDEEVKDEYARKVDQYLKKKYASGDSKKKLPQGAEFAAQRRKERLAKSGRMDEGRASQRHPLEGHEYHKKSNEALVHIAKDAHAAAEAMKSHNPQAENKYRDQANDSATVRHFRKTSGMPDWYKKKYGHVNEDVEQLQEYESKGGVYKHTKTKYTPTDRNEVSYRKPHTAGETLDKSATASFEKNMGVNFNRAELSKLQSKKTLMNVHKNLPEAVVPFDKPYKQDTGTTTDKSGAKHTPMSKVRNLARQAMKKAADRKLQKEAEEPATEPFNKNSKQMSRKAQIVKGASKGSGDAFQKEPVLSASVEKNQSTN